MQRFHNKLVIVPTWWSTYLNLRLDLNAWFHFTLNVWWEKIVFRIYSSAHTAMDGRCERQLLLHLPDSRHHSCNQAPPDQAAKGKDEAEDHATGGPASGKRNQSAGWYERSPSTNTNHLLVFWYNSFAHWQTDDILYQGVMHTLEWDSDNDKTIQVAKGKPVSWAASWIIIGPLLWTGQSCQTAMAKRAVEIVRQYREREIKTNTHTRLW